MIDSPTWRYYPGICKVMDAAAISLARENGIPILVFSIHNPGAFAQVVAGNGNFTMICEERQRHG